MKGDLNNMMCRPQNRFKAGAGATLQKSFKTKSHHVLEIQHFFQKEAF